MTRPRVVFLACHLPYPPLSGGRRRELELIARAAERFDVHLLVASKTVEEDRANARHLSRWCRAVEVFAAQRAPGDHAPEQVLRHRCPALTQRVAEVLERERPDLLHVEGYYLMQHVPPRPGVPLLLVEQNVEYELERQRAAADAGGDDLRTARAMRAEHEAWDRADVLGVVTREDGAVVHGARPRMDVRVLPDGSDHIPRPSPGDARIDRPGAALVVFVGNFAYAPNVDAAVHLCRDVLPALAERVPDARLWLVGNDPPPGIRALADERVRVTGRVDDVAPYIDAADAIACPLRIGGGIKVKSIEALRRGKALVATTVGAQGLPSQARRAVAVADGPEAFAAALAPLLTDPELRARAERRSATAAGSLPTWDSAARALTSIYDELAAERATALA